MTNLTTLLCLFIHFYVFAGAQQSKPDSPDYYWKDYENDELPLDAVEGGTDAMGNTTYIGVVVHPQGKGLIPANVYPDFYAITYSGIPGDDNEVLLDTKNIKLLCSRQKERYRWVPINIDDFSKVKGSPVRGGQEWNINLYVGRASYKDEVKVGKVYRPETKVKGLWLPDSVKTGEYKNFKDFEILVFV